MTEYKYLIVGGGMASDAAVRGIREIDPDGSLGLIGEETDPPYNRPPLSKGLWKGKSFDNIWRKTENLPVTLHLGRKVVSLNAGEHAVRDDQGHVYSGEKLLLATGGAPRRFPFGGEDIIYFRTAADYRRLLQASQTGSSFAVIGGGFIGSEIAAALALNGKKVTQLFPEAGIGANRFPPDLAQFLNDYYRQKGVEVLAGETTRDVRRSGKQLVLSTESGRELLVDGVVAGIGILPNTRLAAEAGLEVKDGIRVDSHLMTSQPGIYAAGDVVEFYNPALGKHIRVEHEDNANTMGRLAGHNLAGASETYDHLPYFYSDLFDLGYEAVGELDASLATHSHWEKAFQKGVVYYLRDNRVRGVLLWNVWDQVPNARKLIASPAPFKPEEHHGIHI